MVDDPIRYDAAASRHDPGAGSAGQAVPLMVVLLLVVAATAMITARVGALLVDHARARNAADAAALAGVTGGRAAAEALAAANHGEVVEFVQAATAVEVRVRIGHAVALARAQAVPDG